MTTFIRDSIAIPSITRLKPLEILVDVKGVSPALAASVLPISESQQQVYVLVDWHGTTLAPQCIRLEQSDSPWKQHLFLVVAVAGATAIRAIPGLAGRNWRSVSLHMQDLDHGEDDEIVVTIDSATWMGKLTTNHAHRHSADLEVDSAMRDWNAGALLAEIASWLVLSESFFHNP